MPDTVFCGDCATTLPVSAKFCHSCGAAQEPRPAPGSDDTTKITPLDAPGPADPPPSPEAAPTVTPASPAAGGEPPARRSLWDTEREGEDPAPAPGTPPPEPEPASSAAGPPESESLFSAGPPEPEPASSAAGPPESERPSTAGWPPAPPSDDPPGGAPPYRGAPGAGELAGELAQRLRTPGVVAAATVGGIALLVCAAVGIVTAIASPDRSIIGYLSGADGTVIEILRLTVGTTLAGIRVGGEGTDFQLLPLVFGLAPVLGAMIGARVAAPSLTGMSIREALAWSAGGAVVFATGMLILALVANVQDGPSGFQFDFATGGVAFMSLLLSGAGATLGALRTGRRLAPDRPVPRPPAALMEHARTVATPLLGLAALLAVATLVSFVHVEVQSLRGQDDAVTSVRSDIGAAVENILFVPDFAIDTAGLALLAQFDDSVLPVSDDAQSDFVEALGDDGKGRIFSYSGALPIYVFLPELLILLGAALVAALYSGFATARRAAAPTQLVAAGWGAVTGIVWSLALVILRAMAFGQSTIGESVFAGALLIGTVGGAIGGLLAVRPSATGAPGATGDVSHG